MTFLAREIQSYKQLPQVWYHFSTKDRDEPRPRGGLLRLREFIMKDSYTFDADEAGLDAAFARHEEAYKRIFERCGLEAYLVEAESGVMGGKESQGLPRTDRLGRERADALRERRLLRRCGGRARRAASGRAASAARRTRGGRDARRRDDRGARGVPLGSPRPRPSKALPVVTGDRLVLALVRGDDKLSEGKLETLLRGGVPPGDGRGDPRRLRRRRRLARAGRRRRRGDRRRGAPRRPVRRRRERGRQASPRRPGRPRLRADLRRHPPGQGRRRLPRVRRHAPHRDGDRGRPHLQARHVPLAAVRRDVSGRGRDGEAARHGQLRHRPRAHDGRDRRAVARRERDRVAAGGRAVRRARRRAARAPRRSRCRRPRRSRRPGSTSSSTIATSGRGRSSPTPT